MRYVISDIHGHYDLFIALLKKIDFSKNDELFICGDILDKGFGAIKLLKWVVDQLNVKMIRGNHEELFLKYYATLMREHCDYSVVLEKLRGYFGEEGSDLTWELVDYLEGLPYYLEEDKFICVHAGVRVLDNGEINPLANTDTEILLHDRNFRNPGVLPKNEKCVFYGHTSLENSKILVYSRAANPQSVEDIIKVQLDVGTFSSGILGCFCVDDCTAHYVTKRDTKR